METYKVIDENTIEVGNDRYVFKNKNCTGCGSCGLYPFSIDCIKDERIKCVQKSLATVGKYGYTSLERWGVFVKETKSNNINMEKERKIEAPDGCEIEKVELIDGAAVVKFKQKGRKLPKSWEEFCEMFYITSKECFIEIDSHIDNRRYSCDSRDKDEDKNVLPDRATAEAVLALCQLIQLRDCYNGDWVPGHGDCRFTIQFKDNYITVGSWSSMCVSPLYFKTAELRDEFLRYFRDLIEKLKPLYGIKDNDNQ